MKIGRLSEEDRTEVQARVKLALVERARGTGSRLRRLATKRATAHRAARRVPRGQGDETRSDANHGATRAGHKVKEWKRAKIFWPKLCLG